MTNDNGLLDGLDDFIFQQVDRGEGVGTPPRPVYGQYGDRIFYDKPEKLHDNFLWHPLKFWYLKESFWMWIRWETKLSGLQFNGNIFSDYLGLSFKKWENPIVKVFPDYFGTKIFFEDKEFFHPNNFGLYNPTKDAPLYCLRPRSEAGKKGLERAKKICEDGFIHSGYKFYFRYIQMIPIFDKFKLPF